MTITLNYLLGRLLISISLSSFSEVLSCSFILNIFVCLLFCPLLCVYLYILGRLANFLILEKWPYIRDVLQGPEAHSSLVTDALGVSPMWLHEPFCCGGANYCGCTGIQGWSLAQLVAKPCNQAAHWWARLSFSANRLEEGLQNGT